MFLRWVPQRASVVEEDERAGIGGTCSLFVGFFPESLCLTG